MNSMHKSLLLRIPLTPLQSCQVQAFSNTYVAGRDLASVTSSSESMGPSGSAIHISLRLWELYRNRSSQVLRRDREFPLILVTNPWRSAFAAHLMLLEQATTQLCTLQYTESLQTARLQALPGVTSDMSISLFMKAG